ncbi:MAG: TIGR00725 family protein [Candidatus Thermoplasmatota archaeon]|nr:TIGR00725 family protein [Candidatus Thermoplasmatota archaeon]
MRSIIAVCGSDADDVALSSHMLTVAESVGQGIATRGGILVCGGRGGVMEAACKGAKAANGLTVGLLPESKAEANAFVDVPISTGLGMRRNFLVVSAADVVIAIGGRWGTLSEVAFAVIFGKPVVLVAGTGGCVEELAAGYLMKISSSQLHLACSAEEAVEKAFLLCPK